MELESRIKCRECKIVAETRSAIGPLFAKCPKCGAKVIGQRAQNMYFEFATYDSRRFLRNSYLAKPGLSNQLLAQKMGSQEEDDLKISHYPFFVDEEERDQEDVRLW